MVTLSLFSSLADFHCLFSLYYILLFLLLLFYVWFHASCMGLNLKKCIIVLLLPCFTYLLKTVLLFLVTNSIFIVS